MSFERRTPIIAIGILSCGSIWLIAVTDKPILGAVTCLLGIVSVLIIAFAARRQQLTWLEFLFHRFGATSAFCALMTWPFWWSYAQTYAQFRTGDGTQEAFFGAAAQTFPVLLAAAVIDSRRDRPMKRTQMAIYVAVVAYGTLLSLAATAFTADLSVHFGSVASCLTGAFVGLFVTVTSSGTE